MMQTIVLTGFRASGKTTVGVLLAELVGWSFVDTDQLLCQRLGAPIADVVARHGWPFFRDAEAELLRELATYSDTVVATGGGAIEHTQEWRALRPACFIVWLDAENATIRQRLAADSSTQGQRPSLTGQDVLDEIGAILAKRRPLYAAGSDLRLMTDDRTPAQLAEAILATHGRLGGGKDKKSAAVSVAVSDEVQD